MNLKIATWPAFTMPKASTPMELFFWWNRCCLPNTGPVALQLVGTGTGQESLSELCKTWVFTAWYSAVLTLAGTSCPEKPHVVRFSIF